MAFGWMERWNSQQIEEEEAFSRSVRLMNGYGMRKKLELTLTDVLSHLATICLRK